MGLAVNYVPYEQDYFYGYIENAKTTNGRKIIFSVSGTKNTENEANAEELVRRWNLLEQPKCNSKCNCVKSLHLPGAVLCPDCQQPKDQPSSEYETRTIENTYLCPCGNVFVEDDDYDTLGSESGVCCPNCGNEKFQTIKDRLDESEASRKELLTALEEAADDFYYIHQHPEDAHVDSYNFMEKVKQATPLEGNEE